MTPQEWNEVKEHFHEALSKPAEIREAFLEQACSAAIVREEVKRLLTEHDLAGDYFTNVSTIQAGALDIAPAIFEENFPDIARFTMLSRLGAGSFGIVYRAFDKERNSVVALKKARFFDSAYLRRFKGEFRSLVDLSHPNLVQLYELFGDEHQWFFTMELVDGVDFTTYARSGQPRRTERLRNALRQLATGVQALHSSGRLHRDLKPSNVLVTAEGRVVILDFGLVKEFDSQAVEQSLALAGSPAYMAPEQAAGKPIDEAADWYAVGVMLYKSLTGELPFKGHWAEILERKQRVPAPAIREVSPDAPQDLCALCAALLQTSPELRAQGIASLRSHEEFSEAETRRAKIQFVGRTRELAVLRERFRALRTGKLQVVSLSGRSGVGKTSLVSRFLEESSEQDPDALIFKARCRESETLPYKAIDPIADGLVNYLQKLPASLAMRFCPRRPELLKRLFPVFAELEIFSEALDRSGEVASGQEIRQRAFQTFRELMARLCDLKSVVISIDDFQWSDSDSAAFLADLVLPASAPTLMLILSFREEDVARSTPLLALRRFEQRLRDAQAWLEIKLDSLPENESNELLNQLLANESIGEEQARRILRESGGHPLLMSELLRFSKQHPPGEKNVEAKGGLLQQMITSRASHLSSTARDLLEVIAVSGEPVSNRILYRAVQIDSDDPAREMGVLIRENLVRIAAGPQATSFETYHDQVREACLTWLGEETLHRWHSQLAQLLRIEGDVDPQRLLRHYRGSGDLPAAFHAAVASAEISESALAFDQAAQYYAEALATNEGEDRTRAMIQCKRADALAKAGKGCEAGHCYLKAAEWPDYNDAREMRRLAAEQWINSGHLAEGIQLFAELLRSSGVHVPAKRMGSLVRMLAIRVFVRMRGLGWRERALAETPALTLQRLDLLWSGAMALVSIDTIFGSYLQALHMLTALRAGEPSRLGLSFSFAAVYECMGGSREYQHGRKLIGLSQEIACKLNDPYLIAMSYGCWAGLDFLASRIEDGLEHCRTAIAGLAKPGSRSRSWELGTFNMLLVWFLGWAGRIRELGERLPALTDEGRSRGDVYTEVCLRCSGTSHLVALAGDDPERAMAEIHEVLQAWRKTSYDLPHLHAVISRVECLLYAQHTVEARAHLLLEWKSIRRSLFIRKSQIHRTVLAFLRGRTALAEWLRFPRNGELRAETEKCAGQLVKLASPWGPAFRSLLFAGIAAGSRQVNKALPLLQTAESLLREHGLALLAAAALRRQGELAGEAGTDKITSADTFMSSQGIRRPDRMTAMILPGNWCKAAEPVKVDA